MEMIARLSCRLQLESSPIQVGYLCTWLPRNPGFKLNVGHGYGRSNQNGEK